MAVPFSKPEDGEDHGCRHFVAHFDSCRRCRRATRPKRRRIRREEKRAQGEDTAKDLYDCLDRVQSLTSRLALVVSYEALRALGGRKQAVSQREDDGEGKDPLLDDWRVIGSSLKAISEAFQDGQSSRSQHNDVIKSLSLIMNRTKLRSTFITAVAVGIIAYLSRKINVK